jgi:hypothetical protein
MRFRPYWRVGGGSHRATTISDHSRLLGWDVAAEKEVTIGAPGVLRVQADAVGVPVAEDDDPSRVRVVVRTRSNQVVAVEFRLRLDSVETWYRDRLAGIFDRDMLREWLAAPKRPLADGEVVFSVDPRSAGERIAIALPDVPAWTLTLKDQMLLQGRV